MSAPVGDCPKNPEGHVWMSWREDPRKPCVFCGRPGRDGNPIDGERQTGGYFAEATAGRSDLIGTLNARRELTDEQKARAAAIVADKKRRDAEAVASGTARPGQVAGKGKRS